MSTATRERPILFSSPMVRAILDGCKTQTRRVVKPQPQQADAKGVGHEIRPGGNSEWDEYGMLGFERSHTCPYGSVGDRLWVRETWALVSADEDGIDDWVDRGPIPNSLPWPGWSVWYRAGHVWAYDQPDDRGFRWRPPIHMPRWASRITLEITDVRVQRLQEISEEDAIAEGVETEYPMTAVGAFSRLWDTINGAGSWHESPWVWAITFRRVEHDA